MKCWAKPLAYSLTGHVTETDRLIMEQLHEGRQRVANMQRQQRVEEDGSAEDGLAEEPQEPKPN